MFDVEIAGNNHLEHEEGGRGRLTASGKFCTRLAAAKYSQCRRRLRQRRKELCFLPPPIELGGN